MCGVDVDPAHALVPQGRELLDRAALVAAGGMHQQRESLEARDPSAQRLHVGLRLEVGRQSVRFVLARSAVDRRKAPRGPRPSLEEEREPVFHDEGGYRMRMEPAALAKLRELPGAKGKTDRELGEEFFKGQSARLVASMAGDVETPAEVRVVVDPYSRQAFLAVGRTIRGIVSF